MVSMILLNTLDVHPESRLAGHRRRQSRSTRDSLSALRRPLGDMKMVWKISMDMRSVLVASEGHLDAATDFTISRLSGLRRGRAARSSSNRKQKTTRACMDISCFGDDEHLESSVATLVEFCEKHLEQQANMDPRPISQVIYLSAMIVGAFCNEYVGDL
ncbi:hypothetical protein B0T10DRAFT_468070 [Thelonectria olida]|uniref:Uncharacterized protein n=1 Tax=Thelonectria olida TaxID=1576542 RepID=A0A9P8VQH8_9HYPO|nr:hypothetical protein B0T10DRAFT_468070 [Thelonectria olida]